MTPFGLEWARPWLALAALPVCALAAWTILSRRHPVVIFPSIAALTNVPPTLRTHLALALPWLRVPAFMLLGLALAGPRRGIEETLMAREGAAIEIVIDTSGSMAMETEYDGRRSTRMEAVKAVFRRFIEGTGGRGSAGPRTDLVGITTFAKHPRSAAPMTLDRWLIVQTVEALRPAPAFLDAHGRPTDDRERAAHENPMNQTGIGNALLHALNALRDLSARLERTNRDLDAHEKRFDVRKRIVILLTDGENNYGPGPDRIVEEIKAGPDAGVLKEITVYPILLMTREVYGDFFGRRVLQARISDEDFETTYFGPLKRVADATGGKAFHVATGDDLAEVIGRINDIEDLGHTGSLVYREYAEKYLWLLLPALVLIGLEFFLGHTLLRIAP